MGLSLIINRSRRPEDVWQAVHGQDARDQLVVCSERRPLPRRRPHGYCVCRFSTGSAPRTSPAPTPRSDARVLTTYDRLSSPSGRCPAAPQASPAQGHPHGRAPPGAAGGRPAPGRDPHTHHRELLNRRFAPPGRLTSPQRGAATSQPSARVNESVRAGGRGLTNAEIAQRLVWRTRSRTSPGF